MAQSSAFFNIRSGSTKSHTYAAYAGKQITKGRVTKMTNPGTEPQTLARIVAKSTMTAWHLFEPFSYNMFEGVPMGNRTKEAFLKVNAMRQQRYMYDETTPSNFNVLSDNGRWYVCPSLYRVSQGSLPGVSPSAIDQGEYRFIDLAGIMDWEQLRRTIRVRNDAILTFIMHHIDYGMMFTRLFIPQYLHGPIDNYTIFTTSQYGSVKWFPYVDQSRRALGWSYPGLDDGNVDLLSFNSWGYVVSEKKRGKWHHSTCDLTMTADIIGQGDYKRALEEWPHKTTNTFDDPSIWIDKYK